MCTELNDCEFSSIGVMFHGTQLQYRLLSVCPWCCHDICIQCDTTSCYHSFVYCMVHIFGTPDLDLFWSDAHGLSDPGG